MFIELLKYASDDTLAEVAKTFVYIFNKHASGIEVPDVKGTVRTTANLEGQKSRITPKMPKPDMKTVSGTKGVSRAGKPAMGGGDVANPLMGKKHRGLTPPKVRV